MTDTTQPQQEKPRIILTPLERTVVYTPTEPDYTTLMRVFECGGWRWMSGNLPTQPDRDYWEIKDGESLFSKYKSESWICFGYQKSDSLGRFSLALAQLTYNFNSILLPEDFYEIQKVSLRQILQINRWFDRS